MNRLFKLFLVGVACAVFSVRFDAGAATYRFDLPSKTLEGGTMALGENAELVLRNIGTADPAALRTLLCDKEGNYLAASTNGFRAAGTAAVGEMSLATAALAARFEGMSALKEIPLVFAVWDTANGTLLGSSLVQVKNNPLADAHGTVPMDWGGVDYGDVAIAQQAYSMATNAWQLSVATSNRMDSLHGDYTAATNDLWEAVGGLESGTGALGDRIAALEGADFGGAVDSAVETLRDEMAALGDALGDGIEPAFTNGTARGLVLSPRDAEAWEESDLAQTPGVYYTTRTNEFGVTIERLLHLVGGVDGVAIAGILAPGGITLPGTFYPLLGRQTWLTVTNWGQITNRYEELYGFTHGNINRLNTFTNDIWRYAQTNRAIATQTRDSLANEKIYRQLRDDDLSNFVVRVRSDAQGWRTEETNRIRQLELATNALAGRVATNEAAIAALNTSLGGVDAGSIAQLRADVDAISAQSAETFTNGTARGLAITPIDHRAGYEAGFSSTPGVWATTEYDYLGEPYGHHLLLHGEGTAALDLSSTGIVANADVAAEGFTLGGRTVTSWDELDQSASAISNLFRAGNGFNLDTGTNTFSLRMDDLGNWGYGYSGLSAGRNAQTGLAFLDICFPTTYFLGSINADGYTILGDDFVAQASLTVGGETIDEWSDLAAFLPEPEGLASKDWVTAQITELDTDLNDFSDTFAAQIEGLQEAVGALEVTDGETTVDLTAITADIANLKSATNHIKGNYAKKSGDTINGNFTVVGTLVQGPYSSSSISGSGANVALGWRARATNSLAFVWSGVNSTNNYGSHGPGTFSVNPVDGLDGFWIGTNTLSAILANAVAGGGGGAVSGDYLPLTGGTLSGALLIGTRATGTSAGTYSFAQGYRVEASGAYSHAEGNMVIARGESAHAEGNQTTASGWASHAEGTETTSSANAAHAEGTGSTASGAGAHAEGCDTLASGMYSHAGGYAAHASNDFSYVWNGVWSPSTTGYGSHGEGSWSANPAGGISNFWIGARSLRQHFSNETVTALSGMKGKVAILPGENITITTNTSNGTLTISAAGASGGGGGGGAASDPTSVGISSASSPRLTVSQDSGGAHTYDFTLSLAPAVDSLNGATGALRLLSPSGAQLGVTDGAIRLPEPPNALTAMGEDVLVPVLVVEENSPRITGFEVDEFGDAVITFWGSATTNRLEWLAAEAESDWVPWDMCSWSYSGTTGTVTVVGAEQGAFYRIVVPEGYGTPDRTNVFLVASVPVYLGDTSVPGNRLATLADVQQAVERGGGAAKTPVVTRRAYKDNLSLVPTNGVAWNFANDGVYIADLSVGGWTEESASVTTNEGTVATNTTTVTHPGTMTLNGETIRSWAELATYADGVEFTVETGVESVNGAEGPVRLVAGDNVSIETDTATGAITISATGGGGGGGGGGSADTNAIVAAAIAVVETHDFQTLTLGGVERNAWPTGGSSGGVASVNGAAGEVTIASGGGITINQSGSAITLSATGGGVGTWSMNSRLLTGASNEVAYSDYLIWMDSEAAGTNQVLTLPNMTNDAQTIVVRHLGNDYPTIIRHGESEWLLQGDGAAVAFDWLLQKGKWFYRQAY